MSTTGGCGAFRSHAQKAKQQRTLHARNIDMLRTMIFRMRSTAAATIALVSSILVVDLSAQLRLREQAAGFTSPLAFIPDPLDRNVQFVVQQNGRIRVVRDGAVLAADFLDLSSSIIAGGEQGLLGLAFTPDTSTSGRFFVNFTNRSGTRSSRVFVGPMAALSRIRTRASICGGAAPTGRRSLRSRLRITTAAISHLGRTGISTSAWATADRATIPSTGRRIR